MGTLSTHHVAGKIRRMVVEARRHLRIPARVEVELEGPQGRALGVSTNLSVGGVGVRVAEADAGWLAVGTDCSVSLTVDGERVTTRGTVIWVTERVVRGERSREIGLRFGLGAELEPIVTFLESFRFRAIVHGLSDQTEFVRRVGDVAKVTQVGSETELSSSVTSPDVAVVVCKCQTSVLQSLVAAAEPRGLSIVAVLDKMTVEVSELLHRAPRLFCQVEPVDMTALAALTVRVLENTAQSEESDRLTVSLERELRTLRDENSSWRASLAPAPRIVGLLGTSAAMQQVADDIERLAELDTTVLLVGETGTGKGVAARALHRLSKRSSKPLIAQNCAALPEALLDSELFGHVRGAFTGAVADRPGIFEAAHGGTIFLDELTEMSPAMQAKLLTVLQDGEFRRVGSTETVKVDVRVICATNRPLEPLVEQGVFREDMYYRLAPFVVRLPPLRARRDDIAQLVAHLLTQFRARYGGPERSIDLEAMALLEQAPWPGNVRQLQHSVERLAIGSSRGGVITGAMVREALALPTPRSAVQKLEAQLGPGESLSDAVERFERTLITAALERAKYVISDAATALGVNRSTLSRRVRHLRIRIPERA